MASPKAAADTTASASERDANSRRRRRKPAPPIAPINPLAAGIASILSDGKTPTSRSIGRANVIAQYAAAHPSDMPDNHARLILLVEELLESGPRCRVRSKRNGAGIVTWRPCGSCADCRLRRFVEQGHGKKQADCSPDVTVQE